MSETRIVALLKRQDPVTFAGLSRSTVQKWIDRTGPKPCWTKETLTMAEKAELQGGYGGRVGVLVRFNQAIMNDFPLTCFEGGLP